MRPWAEWTAKAALVAVGFAAVGVGLSGVALASPGSNSPRSALLCSAVTT